MDIRTELATTPSLTMPAFISRDVPLHDKNWFGTGGSAEFFAAPTTAQEFADALAWAEAHSLPVSVLGEGANTLISDSGIKGMVIRPQLSALELVDRSTEQVLVKAGSGVSMNTLIEYCLNNNLTGLEEFSGIPGTVGGSVYINLHYFEFLLEQFLVCAEVINKKTGEWYSVDNEWFNFGYDYSTLHAEHHYLISATFKLKPSTAIETAYARGRKAEIIRHRIKRYPSKGTCGSFFRNFHDHEVSLVSNGRKMIFVAYYLDKIGVKGQLKVGDAVVSYQHANMIVNQGSATSTDIITLARAMQELVKKHFGVVPHPECRLLGFSSYPLMSE